MDVQALQAALGHEFSSRELLQQALTHRSHSVAHNERLEFLGDSILNCVIASLLFDKFARIDEGDLSRLRANLVKQQSLYEIAQRLELSPYLRLGEGELKSGGFRRPSILADTVEALFGAVFLDAGFEAAKRVIRKLYLPVLETVDPKTLGKDAKTLLQEYLQGRKIALPVYTVVATHGAAHSQEFEVECSVPKLAIQVLGGGGSRRAAEQAAAKKALEAAQTLAVTATKRGRRAKPAQLSLAVAVEQSAEPTSPSPRSVDIGHAAHAADAAAPATAARPTNERGPKAGSIEPARIVAATINRGDATAKPEGRSKPAEPQPLDAITSGAEAQQAADAKTSRAVPIQGDAVQAADRSGADPQPAAEVSKTSDVRVA